MFESMDSEEACGDIYDYGIDDVHLTLINEANKDVVISVNKFFGLSKQYKLTN